MTDLEMIRFIGDANTVECRGQSPGQAPKMLITRLYELLNQTTFPESDIIAFFEKNEYKVSYSSIKKLKALQLTADVMYDCSAQLKY